ncbi:hypothetical protein EG831_10235, partial [bacterium]|nr:hypothetical protein [bacterium]
MDLPEASARPPHDVLLDRAHADRAGAAARGRGGGAVAVERPMPKTPASVSNEFPAGFAGLLAKARSLATGLAITARVSREKPVTVLYPAEKLKVSPRWRGALRLRGALGRDEVTLLSAIPGEHNALIENLHTTGRLPGCVGNCPANVDARGQSKLIADGMTAEAYELVRERNIMPGVLGRICHH